MRASVIVKRKRIDSSLLGQGTLWSFHSVGPRVKFKLSCYLVFPPASRLGVCWSGTGTLVRGSEHDHSSALRAPWRRFSPRPLRPMRAPQPAGHLMLGQPTQCETLSSGEGMLRPPSNPRPLPPLPEQRTDGGSAPEPPHRCAHHPAAHGCGHPHSAGGRGRRRPSGGLHGNASPQPRPDRARGLRPAGSASRLSSRPAARFRGAHFRVPVSLRTTPSRSARRCAGRPGKPPDR